MAKSEEPSNAAKYVINGGGLFFIKCIDTFRDGGTKVITVIQDQNEVNFYIPVGSNIVHDYYPCTYENKVNTEFFIDFLVDAMLRFIERQESHLQQAKKLLIQIAPAAKPDNKN